MSSELYRVEDKRIWIKCDCCGNESEYAGNNMVCEECDEPLENLPADAVKKCYGKK